MSDDDLAPARGIINGFGLSLVFWIVVGVVIAFCVGGYLDFGPM